MKRGNGVVYPRTFGLRALGVRARAGRRPRGARDAPATPDMDTRALSTREFKRRFETWQKEVRDYSPRSTNSSVVEADTRAGTTRVTYTLRFIEGSTVVAGLHPSLLGYSFATM